MKGLKMLMVGILSVALSFSPKEVLAQGLVSSIPDFYYLEDLGGELVSIHACSTTTKGKNATADLSNLGISCEAVAEVTKVALRSCLKSPFV